MLPKQYSDAPLWLVGLARFFFACRSRWADFCYRRSSHFLPQPIRIIMKKDIFLAICLSFLFFINAEAQNSLKLSPEQVAVVERLKEDIPRYTLHPENRPDNIENILGNLDPILVGRNVVFAKHSLDHIGINNIFTREQFTAWREQIDRMYDSYVELTGTTPGRGKIVYVQISTATRGFAALGTFTVGVSRGAGTGSWCSIAAHELAHVFSFHRDWNIDSESIADLFSCYVLETIPESRYGSTRGSQYRKNKYARLLRDFRNGKIEPFRESHVYSSAFELYLNGLVDIVGWETYKKTFRSYHSGTSIPVKRFVPNKGKGQTDRHAGAREFFDRLAHFHDEARASNIQVLRNIPAVGRNLTGAQALRSLSDRGVLLDRYFCDTSDLNVVWEGNKAIPFIDLTNPPAGVRSVDMMRAKWESTGGGTPRRGLYSDGRQPEFDGKTFKSALYGGSTTSSLTFDLGGNWNTFRSGYGQGNMSGALGFFIIHGDNKELFRSALIRDHNLRRVEVNVTGVKRLELITERPDGGTYGGGGIWIEPTLER